MPAGKNTHAAGSEMFPDRALLIHIDQLLDEALIETFPASDPVSIYIEDRERRERKEGRSSLSVRS